MWNILHFPITSANIINNSVTAPSFFPLGHLNSLYLSTLLYFCLFLLFLYYNRVIAFLLQQHIILVAFVDYSDIAMHE